MPLATRTLVDNAGGGLIQPGGQSLARIQGQTWGVVGDAVADHGDAPHDSATLAEGSTFVSIEGIPAVLAGHLATCGDAATGSGHVSASS